jgi:Uma2 family endonuclease
MATEMIASPTVPASEPSGVLAERFLHGDIFYEVVDNQVRELPPMSARETHFANRLVRFLGPFIWGEGLGDVEIEQLYLIDRARNLQRRPDLAFISFERWPRGKPVPATNARDVVPNLAVEVISPTNSAYEVIEKLDDYFASGVQRVWVIYPPHGKFYDYSSPTSVRILTRSDTLKSDDVLPGFELPLAELFEAPTEAA